MPLRRGYWGWVCVVGSGVIGWGPVGLLGVWCSGRGPADHGADAGADWLRLVLFRFGFFGFWIQSEPVGGRQQWPNPVLTKGRNLDSLPIAKITTNTSFVLQLAQR